jgi:hypothetical protein
MIAVRLANTVQITSQRADRWCDRHFIIVEHHNQACFEMAGLIHCFHRHTARQRSIANQSDHVMVLAFPVTSDRHPQRR